MALYTKLSKDLTELHAEMNNYIADANLVVGTVGPPWIPLVKLANTAEVLTAVPSLAGILSEQNLTLKSLGVFTVFPEETAYSYPEAYAIIPLRNEHEIKLMTRQVNEDAVQQSSHLPGVQFYFPEDTTEVDIVPLTTDGVYLVDANVYHSLKYTFSPAPVSSDSIGLTLVATFNENLSEYFS